jgi:hypothetical protein
VRALPLLAPLALLLLATACGSDGSEGSRTALTIVYWQDGERADESVTWSLECGPAAGTHPDPTAACAALDSVDGDVFEPVPEDTACTEIFGGPQRAEITGTLGGERVDATFTRANGCEIERWDALGAVLPDAG